MARAIDADELRNQIRHMPRTVNPDLVQYALVQAIIADMPTLTPPNEPLTQADLDSMDYDKVWIDYVDDGEWALVKNGRIYSLSDLEGCGFEDILKDELRGDTLDWPTGHYTVYRRPPEGEEDT